MPNDQPIDVRDMAIVHRTFRGTFNEAADLIRANPAPSPGRVTFLADHVDFGLGMLHHHHESEDQVLYPLLVQRVPDQAAQTERIEHEHRLVASAIDAASGACSAWRAAPSPETGEALAQSLVDLNDELQPHLDHEEAEIVPLAAKHLTEAEWKSLGDASRAGIPRDRMGMAFGMLLEPLDDDDRAFMKSHLPLPVRLLSPILIDRPWRSYARTLRTGT
jgi:hemerythrin-like domain-containing protein